MSTAELEDLFSHDPPLLPPHGVQRVKVKGSGKERIQCREAAYLLFRGAAGELLAPVLLYEAQGCVHLCEALDRVPRSFVFSTLLSLGLCLCFDLAISPLTGLHHT